MAGEVILNNRPARAVATAEGGQALFLGGLFTLGGVGLVLAGLGVIVTAAPTVVLGLVGADVLIAGALFLLHGVRGTRRRKRYALAEAQRASVPWTWDHAWNPRGIADENPRNAIRMTMTGGAMLLFLLPFNAILWLTKGIPTAVLIGAAIGNMIFLIPLAMAVYLWLQVGRSGRVHARFDKFPFRLGGTLTAQLQLPAWTQQLTNMKATLRCIEERIITKTSGGESNKNTQLFELFAAEQPVVVRPGPSGTATVDVVFELPEGDYATRLSRLPPRYWQLELYADRPGIDYDVKLLMPIY